VELLKKKRLNKSKESKRQMGTSRHLATGGRGCSVTQNEHTGILEKHKIDSTPTVKRFLRRIHGNSTFYMGFRCVDTGD
jgi:hypothetical protein